MSEGRMCGNLSKWKGYAISQKAGHLIVSYEEACLGRKNRAAIKQCTCEGQGAALFFVLLIVNTRVLFHWLLP